MDMVEGMQVPAGEAGTGSRSGKDPGESPTYVRVSADFKGAGRGGRGRQGTINSENVGVDAATSTTTSPPASGTSGRARPPFCWRAARPGTRAPELTDAPLSDPGGAAAAVAAAFSPGPRAPRRLARLPGAVGALADRLGRGPGPALPAPAPRHLGSVGLPLHGPGRARRGSGCPGRGGRRRRGTTRQLAVLGSEPRP